MRTARFFFRRAEEDGCRERAAAAGGETGAGEAGRWF
jgi:hypothetical protein